MKKFRVYYWKYKNDEYVDFEKKYLLLTLTSVTKHLEKKKTQLLKLEK